CRRARWARFARSWQLPHISLASGLIFYTIGYGGRTPSGFSGLVKKHGIRTIVDVRRRPDRASRGSFMKAKTPAKGIERLLAGVGIRYLSLPELGNPFLTEADWKDRYRLHLEQGGAALLRGLNHRARLCSWGSQDSAVALSQVVSDLTHEGGHVG